MSIAGVLRRGGSGPILRGTLARQVLSWDATELDWDPSQVSNLVPGAPVYDVRDFGAVGDGVADDTAAINAAIAAAIALPGNVYLMSRHRITAALTTLSNNNINLIGRGEFNGGTILTIDPPGALPSQVIRITAQYCGVQDVWCVSTRASASGFYVKLDGAYRPFLKNVQVSGYGNGIEISACVGAHLLDCQVNDVYGRYGYYAHGVNPNFCHDTYFERCTGGTNYLATVTGTPAAWAAATAYVAGNIVLANGAIWQCSVGGNSAGAGSGPSGLPSTSTATVHSTPVVDGTVQWLFVMGAASGFAHGSFAHTVTLLKCGWLQGDVGLEVADDAPAAGSVPTFTHSWQFSSDHPFSRGVKLSAGSAIWFDQPLITSVLAGDGLEVASGASSVNVDGGQIFGIARNGVTYAGTGGVRLDSVEIGPVGTQTANTFDGFVAANNAQNFHLNDCISGDVPGFASQARYGVNIGTGCDNFSVVGNTLNGNDTAPILNNTERARTRIVRNNIPEAAYYDAVNGVSQQTLAAGTQTLNVPAGCHTVILLATGAVVIDQIVHADALNTQNTGIRLRIIKEGGTNSIAFRDNNASFNSVWTPLSVDYVLRNFNDAVELEQCITTTLSSIRWRIINKVPQTATISVAVPALAAATSGYANVSTVGTALEGIGTADNIVANPTADLAAAGAGNGGYVNCRVSAANTIRLLFQGTLAGGASNFLFTKVN